MPAMAKFDFGNSPFFFALFNTYIEVRYIYFSSTICWKPCIPRLPNANTRLLHMSRSAARADFRALQDSLVNFAQQAMRIRFSFRVSAISRMLIDFGRFEMGIKIQKMPFRAIAPTNTAANRRRRII